MKVWLVQHAEAKSKEADPQRSLSEKGLADIKKVADYVGKFSALRVESILHSGKTRARQTAEVLAQRLRPPKGVKETDGLEPLADPEVWVKRLAQATEDLMLVGHLPHLSKLSARLLGGVKGKEIINFQMGGIVCLVKDEEGNWAIEWMLIPQIL